MKSRLLIPTLTVVSVLVGAGAVAIWLVNQNRYPPDAKVSYSAGQLLNVEEQIIIRQYEAGLNGTEWPSADSIQTYQTKFIETTYGASPNGFQWRVDVYRIKDRLEFYKYLMIGLSSDGNGWFTQYRNDLRLPLA